MAAAPTDIPPSTSAEQLVDFTCATPWERVALDIELQLRAWGLADGAKPSLPQNTPLPRILLPSDSLGILATPLFSTEIKFSSTSSPTSAALTLSLQFVHHPPHRCEANHFSPFLLERQFGLSTYVLLAPESTSDAVYANAGNLHSLLNVSLLAAGCDVPGVIATDAGRVLFAGRRARHHEVYSAHLTRKTMRTEPLRHIRGLLSLFNRQFHLPSSPDVQDAVSIHCRSGYLWTDFADMKIPVLAENVLVSRPHHEHLRKQFATLLLDPLESISVHAIWRPFPASRLRGVAERENERVHMPAVTATQLDLSLPTDLFSYFLGAVNASASVDRYDETHFLKYIRRFASRGYIPYTTCANRHVKMLAGLNGITTVPAAPLPLANMRDVAAIGSALKQSLMHDESENIDESDSFYNLGAEVNDSDFTERAQTQERVNRRHRLAVTDEFLAQVGHYLERVCARDDTIDEEFIISGIIALFGWEGATTSVYGGNTSVLKEIVDAIGMRTLNSGGAGNVNKTGQKSIMERLTRLVAICENTETVSKVWNLFLDGIQLHWEHKWYIDDLFVDDTVKKDTVQRSNSNRSDDGDEMINQNVDYVIQKLQMINLCIKRANNKSENKASMNTMGRKCRMPNTYIISDGNAKKIPMYEPLVQNHPLTTRDMTEDELKRMIRRADKNSTTPTNSAAPSTENETTAAHTSNTSEATENMNGDRTLDRSGNNDSSNAPESDLTMEERPDQIATLRSDMSSFKAANPAAGLPDFIRWFSPIDWDGGSLSARMSAKDNKWAVLWRESDAVPANRQEPLFDEAAYATKAISDLRVLSMRQVLLHLSIVECEHAHFALCNLLRSNPKLSTVSFLKQRVEDLGRAIKTNNNATYDDNDPQVHDFYPMLQRSMDAEFAALVVASLLFKLPPIDTFVNHIDQLLHRGVVTIDKTEDDKSEQKEAALQQQQTHASGKNERAINAIVKMAGLDDASWRPIARPRVREFVLQYDNDRVRHRMYAQWGEDDFRLSFRRTAPS